MEIRRGFIKEPAIIFESVTKTYPYYGYITAGFKNFLFNLPKALKTLRKRFTALENISFEVYKGECFGIVGKNGAGKSTLLGLIAGVLKPDKGKIFVNGRVSPLLELGAGFHPELTGRENILLNGILLGMTKKEVLKKLDQIIKFSELEEFIDQPIRTYSSGMVMRLAFSVVAHLDPEILLVDEILAVGDIKFQQKCFNKIEEFRKEAVTIVLVSHDINQIRKMCDRVMWIENHKIKSIGYPENICDLYKQRMMR
jgi:lipopolysaccharide transport system ATP-binding protein